MLNSCDRPRKYVQTRMPGTAPAARSRVATMVVLLVGMAFCAAIVGVIARHIAKSSRNANPEVASLPATGTISPEQPSERTFAKKNYFFSAAERSFYEVVCRLAPNHTVFAKVRLADLVRVQAKGREFWQNFNSISSKHVDFVICNAQLAPVVVLELDDASHDSEDRLKRDAFVDDVLAVADIPIVHFRAKRGYALEDLRQKLAPYVKVKSPLEVANPDSPSMPPKGWRPAL